jgi:AraC-like DNA-binding protein
MALLRHNLNNGVIATLEAETLTLALVRRALGERTSHAAAGSVGRQKLVDRAKLVLSSDLGRRWTLADIAGDVGVSPVYLTQVFQQVEGLPLYRYQVQLRLARAVDLLGGHFDLSGLALDLGFPATATSAPRSNEPTARRHLSFSAPLGAVEAAQRSARDC